MPDFLEEQMEWLMGSVLLGKYQDANDIVDGVGKLSHQREYFSVFVMDLVVLIEELVLVGEAVRPIKTSILNKGHKQQLPGKFKSISKFYSYTLGS